jgi:hypothetical protein
MKTINLCIGVLLVIGLVACGTGGSSDSATSEPAVRELQVGETQSHAIASAGEVHTYHLRAAETNRFLQISCEERISGSGVDLLVTVFEEVNGQRVRLFGKHKPDGATLGADLDLWIYIDRPKDLYITVRDLLDNDAAPTVPYYLRVIFQDSAEGNHDFSNARSLTVGAGNAVSDAIDEIGEVDCFTFAPDTDGVYAVDVAHYKPLGGTPVQLALSLYDVNGNRIQHLVDPYHTILAYLTRDSGPYFVIVEDSDSMNQDAAAPYEISVAPAAADEAQANDVVEEATLLEMDVLNPATASGAIAYGCSSISPDHAADADWYQLAIGTTGGLTTYHQVQLTIDNGETVIGTAPLRVAVYDSAMEMVTSHDFSCGGAAYQNQFRAENGDYFVSVLPANSKRLTQRTTYQLQLQLADLNDDAELTDDNTANSAILLDPQTPQSGLVSYHSDVDWYEMAVDTTLPRILAVELTSDASIVDYQLSIWRGDQLVKKITDLDGSDGPTHLKTSILVPADSQGAATYHFKVCDAQNNEGSSQLYSITTDVSAVAAAPGPIAETGGQTLRYYSEIDEEPDATGEVELEIFSTLQPHFPVNTTWLDFRNDAADGIAKSTEADGTTRITFPWICGYTDYQGDRDFFEIDLGKLGGGAETSWYYDVTVRLVVPEGSDVEYVWKLYRDSNRNGIVMDDPTSPDGYKACAGDTTPQSLEAIDMITPDGDETFWIGSDWGEDATFYLGISDFNYLRIPDTGENNLLADNDWGYDVPYYFTITLTYHPGRGFPD